MMIAPMNVSIFQGSRCRINTLAHLWSGNLHSWTRRYSTTSKLHDSKIPGIDGGNTKKWTRRPITTKTEGSIETPQRSKPSSIRHEVLDETVSASSTLNIGKTEITQFQKLQYCDVQRESYEKLASLLTIIVFDIETTGFSRESERIIEIALQVLRGGKNSTFQTLVNPNKSVENERIHGIKTNMVNRPDVPRMKDLIPILLQYVSSHQIPGGKVLLVAHNARTFDVPFLISEFSRSSIEIPSDWLFVDTLPLARELVKMEGSTLLKAKLEHLIDHYEIIREGDAHRAMSDVKGLALIFQRLTFDLKLSVLDILEKSFSASDLINQKKKKSSG
ncbi:exonuclease DPD1, chloroplastic/mitochondrial [Humulus lupulus]|uniref:exonuclease DPD1, chloroplastic/mitochondrial n=1 Tax=Humulus lupulus TaxID=3486 RepID=UPI002B417140|nr:exonuclease DPD1, chloroplastic/mitochondrial [Humulus lupulus]XP_062081882.1 exonuclease DPD1, chloroplastic/mitochondrial [Humulus lupulus]XP_062081883.1 exonuclease DPD1, chloroplastic/mitochondrial [Humulus lupulus]